VVQQELLVNWQLIWQINGEVFIQSDIEEAESEIKGSLSSNSTLSAKIMVGRMVSRKSPTRGYGKEVYLRGEPVFLSKHCIKKI
jgi:hypothetical protein